MVVDRTHVVQSILGSGEGKVYLEIGVQHGESFRLVRATTKIGVDPCLGLRGARRPKRRLWEARGHVNRLRRSTTGELLYPIPSDLFFERHLRVLDGHKIDVAFVDGLHSYEQSYRDVQNCLEHLADDGVVVLHDCRPRTAAAALPDHGDAKRHPEFQGVWNGEVYKTIIRLRHELTDRRVVVLDADQGLGLVYRDDPDHTGSLPASEVAALTFDQYAARADELLHLLPAHAFEGELLGRIRAGANG
jgi:hypothetical protein